jgi:lysyl-tRNA synthetase class 2
MPEEEISINDEFQQRCRKAELLQAQNISPYPSQTVKNGSVIGFLSKFAAMLESKEKVVLAGRIRSLRLQGGSAFLDFEDESGKLQAFIRKDNVGEKNYQEFSDFYDLGDFIEITGSAFETKTKEPTILADSIKILSKTLLPLPDKHAGLKDTDLRFRKRYLDLLANPEVKEVFKLRTTIIRNIREYFDAVGFVEVDTPILQTIAGGATAAPFITHHKALDIDLHLRVAPELYLKRLIIGGYEQVYEIARCFRNEGIDHQHNPEFTQIEFYWAYKDYLFLMDFIEGFFVQLVKKVNNGSLQVKNGEDVIDFTAPYPRVDFKEALDKALNIDIDKATNQDLVDLAKDAKIPVEKSWGRGKLLDELYKKFVRAKMIQPHFIINHPLELSPLAKKLADRPNYVERFQLVVKTAEVCNAFSELNDPLDQEERFKEQKRLKDDGDDEAQGADGDFVEALKHGLPPTAGLGMGIDRLVMLLGDVENIKEVIFFPTMKPKDK